MYNLQCTYICIINLQSGIMCQKMLATEAAYLYIVVVVKALKRPENFKKKHNFEKVCRIG